MMTKLVQQRFLKGIREYEIVNDAVRVRIKRLFRQETLTIGLSLLNPEPVVDDSSVIFYDRTSNEPMLSLWLDNPDDQQFGAFVATLQQRVLESGNAFSGEESDYQAGTIAANVYEEPPEFEDDSHDRQQNKRKPVNTDHVDEAIQMLQKYLNAEEIRPLLTAMEALKQEPDNEAHLMEMEKAFKELGILQGAVLTYAPYISILLAEDPFGER